jgi:CDP-4-dehydro-6-deoxyglucose reductase
MPTVRFGDFAGELQENESALDALLRSGAPVAYSCKAGSCGSCMLRAVEGDVPAAAQAGLKDSWKARGYFLPCVCRPAADLTAAPVDADAQVPARIAALESIGADVMRVRLQCEQPFEFRSGQYLTLLRPDGLARSYSIASLPAEEHVELHIRCLPQGKMSEWVRAEARAGDAVRVLGPSGDCFYVPGRPEQPMLLVGTGTGLAPLYGILRDALAQGHTGPIHLIHGAVREAGLYLRDELARLAAQHPNVTYTPTLLETDGPVDQVVLTRFPKLDGWRAFLCGDPAIVQGLRKKLFLRGMDFKEIYADAFLPAA